jgi:hypothetical protein
VPVIAGDLEIAEHVDQSARRLVLEQLAQRAASARLDRLPNPPPHSVPVDGL